MRVTAILTELSLIGSTGLPAGPKNGAAALD